MADKLGSTNPTIKHAATPTPPSADVVKVRALDWQEILVDRGDGSSEVSGWEADSGFDNFYSVEQYFASDSYGFSVKFEFDVIGDFDDLDRAKECAQKDFEKRALDLIQCAAPGGGTKSDGACLPSLPSGESEPLVTAASAPSDPAQEPQAVALKPCPFCGSHDLTLTVNGTNWQVVQCDNCGASGPCVDLEGFQYIERWNTRPVSLDREAVKKFLLVWFFQWGYPLGLDDLEKEPVELSDYNTKWLDNFASAILALIEGRT